VVARRENSHIRRGVAIVKVAISLLTAVFVCLVSQAFANSDSYSSQETPAAAPTTTTAPASEANATTTSADAHRTSSNPTVLVDKTLTESQVKELLSQGYKPRDKGGQVYYCRVEQVVGTHFETKVCRTAEQIALQRKDASEFMEDSRKRTLKPTDIGN
jgi:ribulose bisphosphate carboxylase small subunit